MIEPKRTHLQQCRILEIPRFTDVRGTLSVIEGKPLLPFEPKRFFYIYDVAEGAQRGQHALKIGEELIVALTGSFEVVLDDGESQMAFQLNRPDRGLYLPSLIWHVLQNFSPGSVCGVFASMPYNSGAYYRVYEEFRDVVRQNRGQ